MSGVGTASEIALFVSHSKRDAALTLRLVDFIEAGIVIPARAIRCSSIPKYSLQGGDQIAATLRADLQACSVVIGVLTKASIRSKWVSMELGAAWALGKLTIPLLAPGVVLRDVPGPFKELRVLKMNYTEDMQGLLQALESRAGFARKPDAADLERASDALMSHLQTRMHPGTSEVASSWLPAPADVLEHGAKMGAQVVGVGSELALRGVDLGSEVVHVGIDAASDVVRKAVESGTGVVQLGSELALQAAKNLRSLFG